MISSVATRVCIRCHQEKAVCTDFYKYSKNICDKCRNKTSLAHQQGYRKIGVAGIPWKESMNGFRNSIYRKRKDS